MTFADPQWLGLLALVPLLAGWEWWRGGARLQWSSTQLAADVPRTWRVRVRWVPRALRYAALALAVVALARPQVENVRRTRTTEGINIMLVLDTSTSMRADDFSPTRFAVAQQVAADFIRGRTSDRIGLVVFAAKAFTQAPLTLDYAFLQRMLTETNTGMIEDGTAMGAALATAVNRLQDAEGPSNIVILLTDGESNRGQIDPLTAAQIAEALGVRVYTIDMGGGASSSDEPAEERAASRTMQAIAQRTGGRYYQASNQQALRRIYETIGALEQGPIDARVYTDVDERYPTFLGAALALLAGAVVLQAAPFRSFP
ncbi:VWA domain-containing protein [Salisaeta longa]|uniref:VWA domain-containing protein n=1 Tax=Salisaeta longa TaxID=503170 RepID=UPI0003B342A6|nr:VWA domain-containing protein [Salisaeta longa]